MKRKTIKIIIENKIFILLKGKIEKKIHLTKQQKKFKRIRIKIEI